MNKKCSYPTKIGDNKKIIIQYDDYFHFSSLSVIVKFIL